MSIDGRRFVWSKESTSDLIDLYQKHPVLYVKKHRNYKNKVKRLEALKAIRAEIIRRRAFTASQNLSINDIKQKIHGCRTQYFHQLSKIRKSQSSGVPVEATYKPTLWCFSKLDFLTSTNSVKTQQNSSPNAQENEDIHSIEDIKQDPEDVEQYNEVGQSYGTGDETGLEENPRSTPTSSIASWPASKYDVRHPKSLVDVSTLSTSTQPKIFRNEKIEDDLSAFGKLVEMEMRNISNPQLLRKVKREIFTILMDAQEDGNV